MTICSSPNLRALTPMMPPRCASTTVACSSIVGVHKLFDVKVAEDAITGPALLITRNPCGVAEPSTCRVSPCSTVSLFSDISLPARQVSWERWRKAKTERKATLTERSMSVSTRVSPVAGEYETVWEPIGKPLYWTENRRLPAAAGKGIAGEASATPPQAQLTAPANPPIRSARRGRDEAFLAGRD